MTIRIVYIVLNLIMYFCLYITGKRIGKIKNITWSRIFKVSWIGIIAFTLNEGLRFGRGLDYNHYAIFFSEKIDVIFEKYEFCFALIGSLLYIFDNPWQMYVLLSSFILIISFITLIKHYPRVAKYALPLFPFFFASYTENLMRWYLGLSFIIMGFSIYFENKHNTKNIIYFTLLSLIGILMHYGLFIIPFIYFIISIRKKTYFNPWVAILLFIFLGFLLKTNIMIEFTNILNLLTGISEKGDNYIENAEKWLSGGSESIIYTSFPSKFLTVFYSFSVVCGYKLIKYIKNEKYIFAYNMYCISYILLPIALSLEIANRYQQTLFIFEVIIWAYILFYIKIKNIFSKTIKILLLLLLLNQGRIIVQNWLIEPTYYLLYIWDSNGKQYLDLDKTYFKDMYKTKNNYEKNNK